MRIPALLALALTAVPGQAQDGQMISAEALFQSCGSHRLGNGCVFHGPQLSYLVPFVSDTPPDLIDSLAGLPPGTPMEITGMVTHDFSMTFVQYVTLTSAQPAASDPQAEVRALLQGDWAYAQDPTYGLRIEGAEWHSLYEGRVAGSAVLVIIDDCPGTAEDWFVGLLIRTEFDMAGQQRCFDLVDHFEDMMVIRARPDPDLAEWRRVP